MKKKTGTVSAAFGTALIPKGKAVACGLAHGRGVVRPRPGEEPQNHRHRQRRADTLDGPGIVRGPGNAAWTETSALGEHIFNSSFG